MCGRFTQISQADVLARLFHIAAIFKTTPRYNVAPTQDVTAIWRDEDSDERHLTRLRWGLIPRWAKDASFGNRTINARSETVFEKPSFKHAARKRRCLVPIDGFYEWKREKDRKQPYYFQRKDGLPMAVAGLWERWNDPQAAEVQSCTLLTTSANALMAPIHHRMPVLLSEEGQARWLDPQLQESEELEALFEPFPEEELTSWPVSTQVNNARNQGPELTLPLEDEPKDSLW